MGSMRFERIPRVEGSNKNVIEFDSSPDRAIARAYGWQEGSVELRETKRDESTVIYDVFARDIPPSPDAEPRPLEQRGRLMWHTRDEMWSRTSGSLHFGDSWPR